MLASMLVMAIPTGAATVAVESTDKPLKFKSGLSNLWFTEKQMTAMPKTIEATIDVPSVQYDIYEGHVLAWKSVGNTTGHYLWVDLIRKNSTHGDLWSNLGIRVLYKNGTTEVQKVFYESLNAHLGKETHIAITFDSDINLYINGELYTGGSYFRNAADATAAMDVYNSIDVSKMPALNLCGDDRAADPAWPKTSFDNYRYFKGGLYNACVFSDVRNATEIAADASSVDTSADNLLMAYKTVNMAYNAKEIADLSGNGYDLKRVFYGKSFTSGFDNLYSSKTQVSSLPKTLEATIELPNSYSDQYWGTVIAFTNDTTEKDGIVWDIREDNTTKLIECRFLAGANGTWKTIRFPGALEAFRGKKVHMALVIEADTVRLYVDGVEFTETTAGATKAEVAANYNAISLDRLELPSIGGDFRVKNMSSQYAVHHVDNWRYFRGKIFSAAMFSDIRTADEISTDKATLPTKGADNLLASYDLFDETDAGLIPDQSGNGYNMAKPVMWLDSADKDEITDYGYSFAVIGDTQVITRDEMVEDNNPHYNAAYKGHLAKLFDWIVNNQENKNIQFAFHMGDITDWNNSLEWNLAMENITKMNGKIPYNLVRGNHDQGPTMVQRYTTDIFEDAIVVGEEFGYFDGRGIENYNINTLNTYQTITVGDVMYLMLALDLGPCKAVIDWANEVIEAHPYHNVIISTHSYLQGDYDNNNYAGAQYYPYMDGEKDCAANMYNPGGYYGPGGAYGVNWDFRLKQHKDAGENYLYQDASVMLNTLVKKHSNISMVLCGHECSEYVKQISATGEAGNNVLQFLVDGQGVDHDLRAETGHAGLVAMFYFSEDGKKVTTEYYSTIREQYLHDFMNVNTYDVNTVTVPASVKTFYNLMHTLKASDFEAAAWNTISAKLASVKQVVITSKDINEIDREVAALQAVIEAANIDYSKLNRVIADAEALDKDDYTAESWAKVETALAAAKAELDSDNQDDIDAAANALDVAISELVEASDEPAGGGNTGDGGNTGNDNTGNGGNTGNDNTGDGGNTGNGGNTNSGNTDNGNNDNGNTDVGDTNNGNTDNKDEADDGSKDESKDTGANNSGSDKDSKENSGCGSAIAASAIVLTTVLALGVGFKKKED